MAGFSISAFCRCLLASQAAFLNQMSYNSQIIEDFRKLGSQRSFQRTKKRMMDMLNDSQLPGSPGTIKKEFPMITNGQYIFSSLNEDVKCLHIDPKRDNDPKQVRYATFAFMWPKQSFMHVTFTLPEKLWPGYLKPNEFPS